MNFVKFHGYGNDYIVCEAGELAGVAAAGGWPEFVRRACDRHYGIGGDGVATLAPAAGGDSDSSSSSGAADFVLRIFNPDGSEAAMSGNGSRSAASFLYFQGLWRREELRLATKAGVKLYRLLEQDGRGRYRFAAEIGRPALDSASIPMLAGDAGRARTVDFPLELAAGEVVRLTAMQMCNPNACVFVDDFASADWRRVGCAIESHPQFPQRTNVEFVRVRDRQTIEVRVYERGVGPTLSSGTGACAATVAACLNGLTDRRVRVEMEGGRLEVEWRDDGEVLLTGEAEVVYRGEWLNGGNR